MCQTLGYHRLSTMSEDSIAERNTKIMVFWVLYQFDRNLSFRFGRAPSIQDYDISLPYPTLPETLGMDGASEAMHYYIDMSRTQGQVYEQLYSPTACQKTLDARIQSAELLGAALERSFQTLRLVSCIGSHSYP